MWSVIDEDFWLIQYLKDRHKTHDMIQCDLYLLVVVSSHDKW